MTPAGRLLIPRSGLVRRPRKPAGPDVIIVAAIAIGLLAASLTLQTSQSEEVALPGWFAALQPVARPAALGLFIIAIIRYALTGNGVSLKYLSGPAWLVWAINLLFVAKMLVLSANVGFALSATASAAVQIVLFIVCVGGEQSQSRFSTSPNWAPASFEAGLFTFAALFTLLNVILLVTYPQAVSTAYGRFLGTTANPQHTMLVSVLCIPVCVMMLRARSQNILRPVIAFFCLVGLISILFLTGSRSGAAAGALVLATCFIDRFVANRLFSTIFVVVMVILVAVAIFGDEILSLVNAGFREQYVVGREDTRSYVWEREWNEFLHYWQIGVPLEEGDRLLFAETYWLSVMSNGGIIGLVLVSTVFFSLCALLARLLRLGMRRGSANRVRIYAAAILGVLVLSTFESLLAGLAAAHTMLATAYITAAFHLIPRKGTKHSRRSARHRYTSRSLAKGEIRN